MPELSEPTSDRVPTLEEIEAALEAHANGAEVTGTPAFQGALLDCLIEARGRSTYFAWAEATARAEDAEAERDVARRQLAEVWEAVDAMHPTPRKQFIEALRKAPGSGEEEGT